MIAGCPKCGARYRVDREKLGGSGVRLRCAKCEAVFRVRAPEAPERAQTPSPAPANAALAAKPPVAGSRQAAAGPTTTTQPQPAARPPAAPPPAARQGAGDLVLVAIPEDEVAGRLAEALSARGVRSVIAHDGVEAVLELQRQLPKAAVVAAHLPKMFGFQLCELVKRNESLRGTWIVLVGAIHSQERYRRPAAEMYGADAYLEMPDLPDGALPLLRQGGVALDEPAAAPSRAPEPPRAAAAAPVAPSKPSAPSARAPVGDGLDEQRAKAERLARIIVSDIVLYNEQKFVAAIREGNVVSALDADLAEGRHLFQERIDARVRAERDYLAEELLRVARARGGK
jgi:predicted Zn finger-like uncharacterized protein